LLVDWCGLCCVLLQPSSEAFLFVKPKDWRKCQTVLSFSPWSHFIN